MPQYLDEPKICIRGKSKSDQLQMLSLSVWSATADCFMCSRTPVVITIKAVQ